MTNHRRHYVLLVALVVSWQSWLLALDEKKLIGEIVDAHRRAHALVQNGTATLTLDIDDRRGSSPDGAPEGLILQGPSSTSQQQIKWYWDAEGRKRMEHQIFNREASGALIPLEPRNTETWDLEVAMSGYEYADSHTVTIAHESELDSVRQPWDYAGTFGADVASFLEETSMRNVLSVSQSEDANTIIFEATDSDTSGKQGEFRFRIFLNAEQMYFPTRLEWYDGEGLMKERVTQAEFVLPGVWFPKHSVTTTYGDGPSELLDREEMTLKECHFNDPDFPAHLFTIELLPGYMVKDLREETPKEFFFDTEAESRFMLREIAKKVKTETYGTAPAPLNTNTATEQPATGSDDAKRAGGVSVVVLLALLLVAAAFAFLLIKLRGTHWPSGRS